jgi:hypothetical protein
MKAIALSHNQRRYLVHIYLTQGYTAAKPLAIQYGISPRTISKYTRAMGHKGKRGREIGKQWAKGTPGSARWQKAIERGAVTV